MKGTLRFLKYYNVASERNGDSAKRKLKIQKLLFLLRRHSSADPEPGEKVRPAPESSRGD
jgi:hypothetical protein